MKRLHGSVPALHQHFNSAQSAQKGWLVSVLLLQGFTGKLTGETISRGEPLPDTTEGAGCSLKAQRRDRGILLSP